MIGWALCCLGLGFLLIAMRIMADSLINPWRVIMEFMGLVILFIGAFACFIVGLEILFQ